MRQRLFAALLLSGCTLGSDRDAVARVNPEDAARKLEQAETAAQGDPSLLARAGWLRYLIASDPKGAVPKLEAAARSGTPADRALALAGLGEIAEDRTDSSAAARHFIAALQTAPTDPIAELAALRLLDLEGESPQIDELIAGAADALRPPVAPRAARLVREAAARIATRRAAAARDPTIELEAWRSVGAVQRWRVGGPFAALRLFDLRRTLPLDGRVPSAATVNDRTLEFPDGDAGLDLEPADGDIFYAVSEVTLERGGEYLLWAEGAAALEARLDGAVAISRVPYPIESPRAQTAAVRLLSGRHHVLVRWSRAEGTRFRLTLARAHGDVSDLSSAAPKDLSGARAAAFCELGQPCVSPPAWRDRADLRAAASSMLEKDPADALAAWLLARAAMGDDRALSRAAVDRSLLLSASGAPSLALRAQQLLHDPEVPDRIGRARALADLVEAARKDPLLLRARLTAAALERDSERFDDAQQELDRAVAALRAASALVPRSPEPLRRLGGALELLGDSKAAADARRAALRLAPGDLQLRQQIALDEGVRLLSWSDRDGATLAKGSKEAPPGASAVRLLDSGAVQMFVDGGGVERVHTVARVFDKKGIAKFGEAQVPSDAQVVHLRTLKADGRVLEPESIPEKEGISLPGLEPGDAVEIDYLRGISPRGPDMPGYSLGAFYFRDDETPMGESTYEVRAPAPPEIDAHNLSLSQDALQRDGDSFRFRHSARDVKPLPSEPHQVAESEVMPWVQLGTGAGQKDLMR